MSRTTTLPFRALSLTGLPIEILARDLRGRLANRQVGAHVVVICAQESPSQLLSFCLRCWGIGYQFLTFSLPPSAASALRRKSALTSRRLPRSAAFWRPRASAWQARPLARLSGIFGQHIAK